MVEPVKEAVVFEQFRTVVPASPRLIEAAWTAVESGRTLQVVTAGHSEITYPLEKLLGEIRGEWVVRDDRGRHRDGLSGIPLTWDGGRYARDPGVPASPLGPAPDSGELEVRIAALHPDGEPLRLGKIVEAVATVLTGAGPAGWGVAEPATEPWSADDLAAFCRDRAPESSGLVFVGPGVTGRLGVSTVDGGVLEEIELSGPPAGTVRQEVIEALAGALAGLVRSMVVAAHPGRRDGLRTSTPTLPAVPYGVLIGHEILGKKKSLPDAEVRMLGSEGREAAWFRLDSGRRSPFEELDDVLRHFVGAAGQDTSP
ncbi:DUF6177 family protein [Amycolatopsis alba]|uniref:Uncharacterized protein n=1 Tax=Amycolatopsis alba DSM 44262 TaxID=1125972 RepID=A0A229RG37_AMYAL|nr:DUF6177 family protein [Amycolatopsis alba]OXM45632.1 hypothetical protein CFP75_30350 [Amycolatopsis alba DSM 44262]